jgi:hypothetical protein
MKNIQSFGPIKFYGRLIPFLLNNKHHWRKVARLIVKLRRNTHDWSGDQDRGFCVDRENQLREAELYVKQALKDTNLPDHIRQTLRLAINTEFKFNV